MNKRQIVLAILLIVVSIAALAAGCFSKGPVSGKSIFESPTPSIFQEPKTTLPPSRDNVTTQPVAPDAATPAPITTTPPTPAPQTATPPPPTPTPTPAPQLFSLNLKVVNPELGNVSVDPKTSDNRYEKGTYVVLYATPKDGAKFKGWSGDASETSASLSFTMESNKNIQAEFNKITFPVTVSAGTGGTISLTPDAKTFDVGATVTAKAVPDKGYALQWWTGDASGTQNPITITVDREKKIGAQFVKAQYVLTTKAVPAGNIDASVLGSHLDGGTSVTLTAKPVMGYRFVKWTGDVTGTDLSVTVIMDSDKTATANFVKQYYLAVNISPSGTGTVTSSVPLSGGGDTYTATLDEGTSVTLTATPNSPYEFAQWSGNLTNGAMTVTFDMNWDKGLTASFRLPGTG